MTATLDRLEREKEALHREISLYADAPAFMDSDVINRRISKVRARIGEIDAALEKVAE